MVLIFSYAGVQRQSLLTSLYWESSARQLNHLLEMSCSFLWIQSLQWLVEIYQTITSWYESFYHADSLSKISSFQVPPCSAWLLQVQLRKAAYLHGWWQFIPAVRPVTGSPLEICSGKALETKASGCAWLVWDLTHVLTQNHREKEMKSRYSCTYSCMQPYLSINHPCCCYD